MHTALIPSGGSSQSLLIAQQPGTGTSSHTPPTFQPGEQLEARVTTNADGQRGIVMKGNFYSTNLPPDVSDGQVLKLIVQQSGPPIVLQRVSPANEHGPLIKSFLQNILNATTPEVKLSDLGKLSSLGALPLPQLLSSSSSPSSPQLQQNGFVKALGQLLENELLLTQEKLQSPNKLSAFLTRFVEGNSLETLRQAKESLEVLAQSKESPPPPTHLPNTLQKGIAELLQALTPNSNGQVPLPTLQSVGLTLTLQLSSLAQEQGFPQLSEQLALLGTRHASLESPSNVVTNTLKAFQQLFQHLGTHGTGSSSPNALSLAGELDVLLQTAKDLPTLRQSLERFLQHLSTQDSSQAAKSLPSDRLKQVQKAMQSVDQFLQGQEALKQMNPLMNALGEPVFILLPALMQGLIQNWEMSISPQQVDPDEAGKERGKRESYERVHIYAELPAIGAVQIDIAHRTQEVLLSLTFTNEDVTEFVDSYLPQLERQLVSSGYTKAQLITRTGTPQRTQPEWCEVLRSKEVVA